MKVSLHSHSNHGSFDGSYDPDLLAEMYNGFGFGAFSITDHDEVTEPPQSADVIAIRGVEHTVDSGNNLHIVELPDHDFRWLAHPRFTFGGGSKDRIRGSIREHDLDGVEKYNSGRKQYQGRIDGVVELANDDAHNHFQIGSSYMRVPEWVSDEHGVVTAIRAGEHTLHNNPASVRRVAGSVAKRAALVSKPVRSLARPGSVPDKEALFYETTDRPQCSEWH